MNHLIANLYGEYEVVQKTGCDSRSSGSPPSDRLQLSHGKKVFKQLQDNQESDYEIN